MRRSFWGIGLLLGLFGMAAVEAAPAPKTQTGQNQPSVDGDKLPPGDFVGTLVSVPDDDRMFTLKVTYPEVRLKPGAKPPNFSSLEARTMNQVLQDLNRAQQAPRGGGGYNRRNAASVMMHQQQQYMQSQQRMSQAMARAQQKELQLLQRELQAIQNLYQVVQTTREVDLQADVVVKVRIKDLPEEFDEKGNVKKYTVQEKAALKGKDKNLPGYESSPDALKVGQTVQVTLRTYKKPTPKKTTISTSKTKDADKNKDADKDADKDKDKDADKDKEKDKTKGKDADKDKDASTQHKMQVKMIVILKESDTPQNSTTESKKKQ
jgi:hypothetical protein